MSTIHLIVTLVIISIAGYIVAGLTLFPTVRLAWRHRSIAGGFVIALAFANGWILSYLIIILLSYFLKWDPGNTYVVLAIIVAAEPWLLLIWWLRRTKQIDSVIATDSHKEVE
jgi:accessory gene regulator protein AgrB